LTVKEIGKMAFRQIASANITIPTSVTSIDNYAASRHRRALPTALRLAADEITARRERGYGSLTTSRNLVFLNKLS
jgi:hypothetical protein